MPKARIQKTEKKTATATMAALAQPLSEVKPFKEALVHHVYFWLKNPDSPEDMAALLAGLESLTHIETIRFAHIGMPAATQRPVIDSSYSVSWLCFFDDVAKQEVYQSHPIHLTFVDQCAPLWQKVIVYDSIGISK